MTIIKMIVHFLSSMRTGLVLLVAIGLMSIVTSFLPDNFYQAIFFNFFLILLLVNMTLCTSNQLARYLKSRSSEKGNKLHSFRSIGILLLHAGIVLVLIGGTINSFNGQTENLKIVEGDSIDISTIIHKAKSFSLRLDQFKIDFNADGSPSQYYSNVSVVEGGNVIKPYSISVNDPLVYRGIKAYQKSFGYLVDVQGESNSGWIDKKILQAGDIFEVQGTDKVLMINKYIPNFDPQLGIASKSLRPDNPRIIYSIYQKGAILSMSAASFGEKVEIEPGIDVKFNGIKPFTVLEVKRDPGLPLAAMGGLMLMIGVCLALILKGKKQGDVVL